MNRRIIIALLTVLLLLSGLTGQAATVKATPKPAKKTTAQYTAYLYKDAVMRSHLQNPKYRVNLKEGTKVFVLNLGKTWSHISYRKETGYVKTNLLVRLFSLDVKKYPLPGRTVNIGIVTLKDPTPLTAKGFPGLTANAGAMICVTKADSNEYLLPIWRSKGTIPASSGEYQAFTPWEEAQPGDLIGGFSTYYDKDYGKPLAANRAYNVELACKRIHNTVLKPGKQFSFNRLCGRYNQKNGYKMAPNISAAGRGYGGGVCQVSTTLYNAILGVPLQVNETRVHQDAGVKYVPQWFDSAVSVYSDLRFTNTLGYPIRIWADAQGGALTVLLYRDK